MQIKTQRKGPVLIAKVTGELDHHSAKQFVKEMDKQLSDDTVRELQLDFKGLTFMDSSGIGALLGRYKKLAGKKGKLTVKNMNRTVGRIFEMSGLSTVIKRVG
jgi:stage II sporulation protein AA (anti-sigma F factor antagonist)